MNKNKHLLLLAVFAALLSAGCTVSEVIHAERTELDVATLQISESMLLDVGIMNFEPGVPERNNVEKTRIYPEVRLAEARYVPYHLNTPLPGTALRASATVAPWGAVQRWGAARRSAHFGHL